MMTVPWMDMIRNRLKEFEQDKSISPKDLELINTFIHPIIEYGEEVEEFINQKIKEEKERW